VMIKKREGRRGGGGERRDQREPTHRTKRGAFGTRKSKGELRGRRNLNTALRKKVRTLKRPRAASRKRGNLRHCGEKGSFMTAKGKKGTCKKGGKRTNGSPGEGEFWAEKRKGEGEKNEL